MWNTRNRREGVGRSGKVIYPLNPVCKTEMKLRKQ